MDDNEVNGRLAGLREQVLKYHIDNQTLQESIKRKDSAFELLVSAFELLVEAIEKIKELHDGG